MDSGTPAHPFAVAAGNASLLGVGYLLLRRWLLASLNVLVTVTLVVLLASGVWPVGLQVVAVVWWFAVIVHGWLLARRAVVGAGRQWVVALAAAVPVVLAVTLLRVDGLQAEQEATAAHAAKDCARAVAALDGLGVAHRVADAPLVAEAEDQALACRVLLHAERQAKSDRLAAADTLAVYGALSGARWAGAKDRRAELILEQAREEFDTALTGDVAALRSAFGHLDTVRSKLPGRDAEVDEVRDGFLAGLPAKDPCDTVAITDWLADRPDAADVVEKVAPRALVACGDDLRSGHKATKARARYRQALREYPDHAVSGRAEHGLRRANLAIELARLRKSLRPAFDGDKPSYCRNPVPYSGAERYRGRGPHRVMLFGANQYRNTLPSYWRARDAADAVLVICAGQTRYGTPVQTCPYESKLAISDATNVTFHKKKFAVRVYEVRTGRRLHNVSELQIEGESCPAKLYYESYVRPLGPPSQVYVKSSKADIRAAFESLVRP